MTEATIRTAILKYLNSLPEAYFEVSPPGSPIGKPDITGVYRGRYIAVEVKRPGKEAERHQAYVHGMLRGAGAIVFVAHSLSEAKVKLTYWLEKDMAA
jgi:hypothetical protein